MSSFTKQHPDHCPHCNGWGKFNVPGCDVPYSDTWARLPNTIELCGHCLDEDKCPWCQKEVFVCCNNRLCCADEECGWDETCKGMPNDEAY